MPSGPYIVKPVPPGAGLHQLLQDRLNNKNNNNYNNNNNTKNDSTTTTSPSTHPSSSSSASTSVWAPVIKAAVNIAICIGVGLLSNRLFTRLRNSQPQPVDDDDKSSSECQQQPVSTHQAVPTQQSPHLAAVYAVTAALNVAPQDTATTNGTPPDRDPQQQERVHESDGGDDDDDANTDPETETELNATTAEQAAKETSSTTECATPATEGAGSTTLPVAPATLPVLGSLMSAYVYAFFGCSGLSVPQIDLSNGGPFHAHGLPRYNFRVVDFTGKAIDVSEHATALHSLRLLCVPGGDICVAADGHRPATFTPCVKEVLYGRSGTRRLASRIKIDARPLKGLDQGDDVAAVLAHVTGLAGARLMHVLNDPAEGPADHHLRIVTASRALLDQDDDDDDDTNHVRRSLVAKHDPHAVLAVDDVPAMAAVKPGDAVSVGDAKLRVVSTERIDLNSKANEQDSHSQVLLVRATVVGDDTQVLSVGDPVAQAAAQ